jgi:Fe-Mn family superoxide dismutase
MNLKTALMTFSIISSALFAIDAPVQLVANSSKVAPTTYKAKNFYHLIGMKGFSDKMLSSHFELYQGYVNNTNLYHDKLSQLIEANMVKSPEYQAMKKSFAFEFDGMKLHELYFENLGGKGVIQPTSGIYKKIIADFGSFDLWKRDFVATGLVRGIGWVITYFDPVQNKIINTWIESHENGLLASSSVLVVMDCWEHAYILDYGIKRADYIDAFMDNLNWNIVSNRFDLVSKPQ